MGIARKIYYFLPPQLRFWLRRLYFLPTDIYHQLFTKYPYPVPPKGLIYTGGGDFVAQGQKIIQIVQALNPAYLNEQSSVLDIGSGIGRFAVPLTQVLGEKGHYQGFDVVKMGVDWCQKNIAKKYPQFHFDYIPLKNDLYRSDGMEAASFTFPYEDDQYDFAVSNSVFTHMPPDEVENYIKELARVLKHGGVCYATFFIINEESEQLLASNKGFDFPHDFGHYRLMDKKVVGANVAFQETYLRKIIKEHGLNIETIFFGHWCGRAKSKSKDFQDLVMIKK